MGLGGVSLDRSTLVAYLPIRRKRITRHYAVRGDRSFAATSQQWALDGH